MIGRGELTDKAWAVIAPLPPAQSGQRGGRWRSHRQVINASLWKERTGAPRRDLTTIATAVPDCRVVEPDDWCHSCGCQVRTTSSQPILSRFNALLS